jgi:hypothetical protein
MNTKRRQLTSYKESKVIPRLMFHPSMLSAETSTGKRSYLFFSD